MLLLLAACSSSKTASNDNDGCVGRCGMVGGVACGDCEYGYTCNEAQFCVEILDNDFDLWTEEPDEDLAENEFVDSEEELTENDYGDEDMEAPVLIEEDEIIVDTDETVDADLGLIACLPEHETRSIACGFNGNGLQDQICTNGHWVDTGPCDDPDDCANGRCVESGLSVSVCCENGHLIYREGIPCSPPGVAGCTFPTGCC